MQVSCNDYKIKNTTFDGYKVKKWIHDDVTIFNAGTIAVTYHVDSDVQYTEDRNNGDNSLSPNSFTPSKTGYDFVGWREDSTANSTVLTSKVVENSPITLYAVFKKAITVTLYNGSTAATNKTEYQYYNNGNTINPKFTVAQTAISGWTTRGWSTSTTGNATPTYSSLNNTEITSDMTLYGLYQIEITLTCTITGSVSYKTGTRYYNSKGVYVNPTFTVANPTKSGGTFLGWSTSASSATISYSTISNLALTTNTKIYSVFKFADTTVSPASGGSFSKSNGWFSGTENQATIYSSVDTSKYYAAQLTLSYAYSSTSHRGQQVQVYVSDGTNNTRIVYSYVDWTGNNGNGQSYSDQGQNLKPTLTFSTSSGSKPIYLRTITTQYASSESGSTVASYSVGVSSIKLLGRTSIG